MSNIRSEDLENKLIEWKEPELFSAFKGIVGCDGKIIFPANDAKTYGEDRFEKQRRIINLKKDKVIELAKFFDLDVSPLFEALNIPIENIIKKTCKELGLTYAQLADEIGYKSDTVNSVASRGNISDSMKKAIEMYLEIKNLKNQLNEYDELKKLLKKVVK